MDIRAPFSGVIGLRSVSVGDYVKEGADMVNLEFMWFEDLGGGRSRLRGRSICPNTEARDALLSSGMEGGMTEGYEKLDALLKTL